MAEEFIGDMWKKFKMAPVNPDEVVYEIYGHGRVVGRTHPYDLAAKPSTIFRLPVQFTPPEGMRMVGLTIGHISYSWTEVDPNA